LSRRQLLESPGQFNQFKTSELFQRHVEIRKALTDLNSYLNKANSLTILWGEEAVGALEVAVLEKGERGLGVALDVVLVGDGTAEIGHAAPLRVRRSVGTASWMLRMGSGFGSPRC
jgi:hypothetical protein